MAMRPPLIDFCHFEDASDLPRQREITRTAVRIGAHKAFDGQRLRRIQPLDEDLVISVAARHRAIVVIGAERGQRKGVDSRQSEVHRPASRLDSPLA